MQNLEMTNIAIGLGLNYYYYYKNIFITFNFYFFILLFQNFQHFIFIFYILAYGTDVNDPNKAQRGPVLTTQPYDVLFTDRTTVAYLECVATGNPAPTYTWYREIGTNVTQKITSSLSNRYTLSNGRLTIARPNETIDIGIYQCKAENEYGSILSSFIELTWGCKLKLK